MTLEAGAQMVANRLRKNQQRLKGWLKQQQISCYRQYDADLPEYAAAIDVYAPASGAQPWLHVQEYQAPATIDPAIAAARLDALVSAAAMANEIPLDRIAIKTRLRAKGGSKYGRMAERGDSFAVREGAVRLEVNLFDYLDTGLFLDHRAVRRQIASEVAGACAVAVGNSTPLRFLNVFCYTGAVTTHAAVAGAHTTSVDLSATYLEWARRNLTLNDCGPAQHALVKSDAMRWLADDRAQYDLIFCDPPTFSNSKSAADFDVQREHVRLLALCIARLAPGGRLLFSNNYRRFQLDAAAIAEFAIAKDITGRTIDRDFARNPKIHCCFELRAR